VGACRIVLQPGDAVLMFTDGLVESRSRTADQGVAQLVEMLRTIGHDSHGGPPYARRRHRPTRSGPRARELCARVLAEMGAGGDDDRDDVALLVLRRRRQRR
jgi:serine phosphatase RsbU (regulator of sigma subunit)